MITILDENIIVNHIYIKEGLKTISFILNSNKNFVVIETENEIGKKFAIKLSLRELSTIVETLKSRGK